MDKVLVLYTKIPNIITQILQKNRCPKAPIEEMILMKFFSASTVLRGVKIK